MEAFTATVELPRVNGLHAAPWVALSMSRRSSTHASHIDPYRLHGYSWMNGVGSVQVRPGVWTKPGAARMLVAKLEERPFAALRCKKSSMRWQTRRDSALVALMFSHSRKPKGQRAW